MTRPVLVLVKGPALSGKSRTTFQAVRKVLGDAPLLAPKEGTRLDALLDALAAHATTLEDQLAKYATGAKHPLLVVWIRDLPGLLHVEALRKATDLWESAAQQRPRLLLIATATDDDVVGDARDLVGLGTLRGAVTAIEMELPLSDDRERRAAKQAYPEEDQSALQRAVGHYFAGAEEFRDRLHGRRPEVPQAVVAGRALVRAAVDWRRVGLRRPVPEDVLRKLHLLYLLSEHPLRPPRALDFDDGLSWALQPGRTSAGLLSRQDTGTAGGYLAAALATEFEHRPVPVDIWPVLCDHVLPGEAMNLAEAAFRDGEPERARRLLLAAATKDRSADAARAKVALAEQLSESAWKGFDQDAYYSVAEQLLEDAAASSDPAVTALARCRLGAVLHYVGVGPDREARTLRAEMLLDEAEASEDPAVAAEAARVRGALLSGVGHRLMGESRLQVWDVAQEHLARAARSGIPRFAEPAVGDLASLLVSRSLLAGQAAGALLDDAEKAIGMLNAASPHVNYALGRVTRRRADLVPAALRQGLYDKAEGCFRQAMLHPAPVVRAQSAASSLGNLLVARGSGVEAERIATGLMEFGALYAKEDQYTSGASLLAAVLVNRAGGYTQRAARLLEIAMTSRDADVALRAKLNLGLVECGHEPARALDLLSEVRVVAAAHGREDLADQADRALRTVPLSRDRY